MNMIFWGKRKGKGENKKAAGDWSPQTANLCVKQSYFFVVYRTVRKGL